MEKITRKIYYDAEFTGLHINTTLISIGMVSDSGAHFYAEFSDYNALQVSEWIKDHVISNLIFNEREFYISPLDDDHIIRNGDDYHWNIEMKADSSTIKERLMNWLKNEAGKDGKVQFYVDTYAYDWVLLNNLICDNGLALNLPDYIYYIPVDLSTTLQLYDEDPDVNRERFLGDIIVSSISNHFPLNQYYTDEMDKKHNSLWDAIVCEYCFNILLGEGNKRFYSAKDFNEAVKKFCENLNINKPEVK